MTEPTAKQIAVGAKLRAALALIHEREAWQSESDQITREVVMAITRDSAKARRALLLDDHGSENR